MTPFRVYVLHRHADANPDMSCNAVFGTQTDPTLIRWVIPWLDRDGDPRMVVTHPIDVVYNPKNPYIKSLFAAISAGGRPIVRVPDDLWRRLSFNWAFILRRP